jgi:hypothetical protein
MNRIKSTAQYMCRWIFVECKYIKYRIRTDILRQPDRYVALNEILVTQDMFDSNGKIIPERVNMRYNMDEDIRNIRNAQKNGRWFV